MNSSICKNFAYALDEKNVDNYNYNFKVLDNFYEKYYFLKERVRILGVLEEYASDWANHIKNRIGIHGENEMPENVEDAWL